MKNQIKQRLYQASIMTVKIVLGSMLALSTFVLFYFGLINRGHVVETDPIRYLNDWAVTIADNGDQTLKATLPRHVADNEYLYFETRKDVYVYINGALRKDFVEARDINIPGGSFKRFLLSIPLNASDSGAEITIVRIAPQDIDFNVPDVILTTRYGAMSYLLEAMGTSFSLSFIVLIFSFAAFVVSLVLRFIYKQRMDLLYGALGIFVIAAWLITDNYLFPISAGVYHVDGLLNYMLCLMIPLPLAMFISSIQKGRYPLYTSIVMLISVADAVIWPILHYTGILPFYRVRNIANAVLVLLIFSGFVNLTIDAARGYVRTYRYTSIGFIGFLVGGLTELLIIFLNIHVMKASVPIVVGLGFLLTFIVIQQVDDLRKLNAEKQQAIDVSEAKTRFLASMSHEIRTPINAILGMNEMILRENSDQTIDEYARNIKSSGKMLLMLVNDVLDFTKIESGKLEIREAEFRMSDMLGDVLSLIQERAQEKSLILRTEVADGVPNVMLGDEFRIRQILVNLLNNAVKYTDRGGITLNVGGQREGDAYELLLQVGDTGKGIRKEDQPHLFEAFSRADLKSNANIEGTGLGLAIVKSIVDSMKGDLGVESEYGIGSNFWVKLPLKYQGEELLASDFMEHREERKTAAATCSFTAVDARILAVDDNQSNLKIVKFFLKRNGIVPDLCSSGSHAIELCREKEYDLILLDHMMPEPDGIETLHVIRSDEKSLNKKTKVVVLTANAVAGSKQTYLDEGFDAYLTKPLDSTTFEETVRSMLPEGLVQQMEKN